MMDRHRVNVCSNDNVMPITEKMKDGMQSLSLGEIPSFDFSGSIATLTCLRVVTGYCVVTSYCPMPHEGRVSS